MKNLYKEMINR